MLRFPPEPRSTLRVRKALKTAKKKELYFFSKVWFMIFNFNLLKLFFFFGLHISEHLVGRLFQHHSKVTAGHSDVTRPCDSWASVNVLFFVQYFINIIIIIDRVNDLT